MFYVLLPFQEYKTGFKMLQPVEPWLYWSTTFLFDAILHVCVIGLLMLERITMNDGDILHTGELSKFVYRYIKKT